MSDMVGIVIVSHSKDIAKGTADMVRQMVGSEVKEGEKVPDDQLVMASFGNDKRKYRRLKVGDRVELNDLLGRIDDRLVGEHGVCARDARAREHRNQK